MGVLGRPYSRLRLGCCISGEDTYGYTCAARKTIALMHALIMTSFPPTRMRQQLFESYVLSMGVNYV